MEDATSAFKPNERMGSRSVDHMHTVCAHTNNIYMPGREKKKNNHLDPNNSCEAMSREY